VVTKAGVGLGGVGVKVGPAGVLVGVLVGVRVKNVLVGVLVRVLVGVRVGPVGVVNARVSQAKVKQSSADRFRHSICSTQPREGAMDNTHRRWKWPAVLILPLAFVQWVPAQAPTLSLQVGSTSAYRGSVIHIPVSASGGTGGTAAAQLDIVFSTSALTVPESGNACTVSGAATGTHTARTSMPSSPSTPAGHAPGWTRLSPG
jgi:hypothetical protein